MHLKIAIFLCLSYLAAFFGTFKGSGVSENRDSLYFGIELERVPHEQFKALTRDGTSAFVRTGECTPYANVILCSGVTFG